MYDLVEYKLDEFVGLIKNKTIQMWDYKVRQLYLQVFILIEDIEDKKAKEDYRIKLKKILIDYDIK